MTKLHTLLILLLAAPFARANIENELISFYSNTQVLDYLNRRNYSGSK
ncbi:MULTISPECIES: hypothetical protein [unclassified Eikenella]|nr:MULTISPECIES: hypothetical protein [unclassified Eikenella]